MCNLTSTPCVQPHLHAVCAASKLTILSSSPLSFFCDPLQPCCALRCSSSSPPSSYSAHSPLLSRPCPSPTCRSHPSAAAWTCIPVTVNCSVASTILLIQTVAGFPASRDLSEQPIYISSRLNNYNYFTTSPVWLNPNDPTNTSVYVNVTTGYYPHLTGVLISVSFIDYYGSGTPSSPAFAGFSYQFDGPPILTSIGGCDGSGQSTLNCVPDIAQIELTGSGLLWFTVGFRVQLNIGAESTPAYGMQVVNDSYAILPLAWVYGYLLKPQHYAGVLLSFNLTSAAYSSLGQREYTYTTNSMQISFVPLPPPNITEW